MIFCKYSPLDDLFREIENALEHTHKIHIQCGEVPAEVRNEPRAEYDKDVVTDEDFYRHVEKHNQLQFQVDEIGKNLISLAELVKKLAVEVEKSGEKS